MQPCSGSRCMTFEKPEDLSWKQPSDLGRTSRRSSWTFDEIVSMTGTSSSPLLGKNRTPFIPIGSLFETLVTFSQMWVMLA